MALSTITPPAVLPVRLDELKDHLRIIGDDDNSSLLSYLQAAVQWVENQTQRALISRTLRLTLADFPKTNRIKLPLPPLVSVSSVKYRDLGGALVDLDPDSFRVSSALSPGQIELMDGYSWPDTWEQGDGVEIEFVAGYGVTAETIPAPLLQAIRFFVAHFYSFREPVVVGASLAQLPFSVEALISPFRFYMPGD